MVYSQTQLTALDVRNIDRAYDVCKKDKQSNGYLISYIKYKDMANIKCGNR